MGYFYSFFGFSDLSKICLHLPITQEVRLDLKNMTPFHLAAKIGHFLLFNSLIIFQITDFGC